MEPEKVTIVLPTYNRAKFIRKSIDSCLEQTYRNIELIIVDDASKDETPEIVKSYGDQRIKYIRNPENLRLPNALNAGFANSSGVYLTWTSDDNYYDKAAIKQMVSFLKEKRGSFVYCDYYWVNDENAHILREMPDVAVLEKANHVQCCFLYSREVMAATGDYDPSTELAEDYDYWIRVSKRFSMHHLNKPLYFYRVHKKNLITTRYYEAYVVSFLVRLKNAIPVDKVMDAFIYFITRDKLRRLKIEKARILPRIIYSLSGVIFSRKIRKAERIFMDYKLGKLKFENAKLDLIKLMNFK
jgi:glycosyltransferase involved in cell wall biosynthesis